MRERKQPKALGTCVNAMPAGRQDRWLQFAGAVHHDGDTARASYAHSSYTDCAVDVRIALINRLLQGLVLLGKVMSDCAGGSPAGLPVR